MIRGAAPSRHLREPNSPAPPPWMDNPEEAGIGRRRRTPLRSEAVGRLQKATEICTKPPQICNAAVQKTRRTPEGADVT
ncbi:MAG: hypothetical protein ACO2PM_03535 [Pyrobaculum sp.]